MGHAFWSFNSRSANSKRRQLQQHQYGKVEAFEPRMVLSSDLPLVSTDVSNYDHSQFLVQFRTDAPVTALPGTSIGQSVGTTPGLYQVSVGSNLTVESAVAAYRSLPTVQSAQLDYQIQLTRTTNDPRYSSEWALPKIAAPAAWDTTTGSRTIIVAVVDTGIDYNHPDLAANMWKNTREIAGDGIDNDRNGYTDDVFGYDFANNDSVPLDDNNHGTHVAGTIGAVSNNSVGIAGVAWNVQLMALKFMSASGSGSTSNAVRAIDYAVANGAKVINNSWGGGGFDAQLDAAISRARAAGVIVVVAAGNDSRNNDSVPSYPSAYNYDNIVSVAATDSNDMLASFSNYGATSVDIAAPGVSILSTTPNNTYSSFSGTSMAAPHVSGAIALVWSANPTLTYTQVIGQVYRNVDPIAGLAGRVLTGGRLNVAKAVTASTVDRVSPTVSSATWSNPSSGSIDSVTVSFSEAINANTFTAADVQLTGPSGQAITVTGVSPVAGGGGSLWKIAFNLQTASGNYTLKVGPQIADLANNLMNQDGDSTPGEATQDQFTTTATIVAAPVTKTFSSTTQLAIRDNATTTQKMNVTTTGTIKDLNVKVNLLHTYDGDLVITLVSPDGSRVLLSNRRGGTGDNFRNTVFDDQASGSVVNGAAPFTGSFRPEALLSSFNGKAVNGNWTLEVRDAAAMDVGTLLSWDLIATVDSSSTGTRTAGFDDATVDPIETTPGKDADVVEPITTVQSGSLLSSARSVSNDSVASLISQLTSHLPTLDADQLDSVHADSLGSDSTWDDLVTEAGDAFRPSVNLDHLFSTLSSELESLETEAVS